MKNNFIANTALYFSLIVLVIITFYQVYIKNPITNNELNIVYPFFFLIISLFHIIKYDENEDKEISQVSGFKNLILNWRFHKNKPYLILLITVLAITYSALLVLSGENILNIAIIIFSSIFLFTSVLFFVNIKVVKYILWINFYLWQISLILFSVFNINTFFLDNYNPLGGLIPYIFQ